VSWALQRASDGFALACRQPDMYVGVLSDAFRTPYSYEEETRNQGCEPCSRDLGFRCGLCRPFTSISEICSRVSFHLQSPLRQDSSPGQEALFLRVIIGLSDPIWSATTTSQQQQQQETQNRQRSELLVLGSRDRDSGHGT